MKVAKEFRWEMGHRLPEHFGLCKNIHGHSYKLIAVFEGILNENGMVIDFYDVEKIINPVIKKLDHAFMVNKNDTGVIEFLDKINSKKVIVDFDATAENICNYILEQIKKKKLPENVHLIRLRVYETDGDYAEQKSKV